LFSPLTLSRFWMNFMNDSASDFELLSKLVLTPPSTESQRPDSRLCEDAEQFSAVEIERLATLAYSNHVVLRAFQALHGMYETSDQHAEWIAAVLDRENRRIAHALTFLEQIRESLEREGCPTIVIKSLDHWPDLGNDLDLYTPAPSDHLIEIMRREFKATVVQRSWGDRLASKWNFSMPGLPELVEVHVGRLGQTGEQTAITNSLMARAERVEMGGHSFRVAAPEHRIIISTLQRMYRHFYIRLCDVADNARLLEQGIDFQRLYALGHEAGLWEGIATYFTIISEYVESYRRRPLPLPPLVTRSAKFGAAQISFSRDFLRVPIVPQSLNLYGWELRNLMAKGKLRSSLRLSILPYLATAALFVQKITGDDKGIW
jgi:hypothetical protein